MSWLLDTHTFLWAASDDPALSPPARSAILDPANELLLSLASIWEIAIKQSLGKLQLGGSVQQLVDQGVARLGLVLLAVKLEHCQVVSQLPFAHKDPFDRLLVSQARIERLRILSCDRIFDDYGIPRVW
ncbi:type II toxin-antitoxin system VapC family toxin [bacterium CPR1]|nr:type II toxin-antitoxin system VapC family toxin [bacterium CPR1]